MTDQHTIETKFKLEGIDGAIATVRAFGEACEALPPGFEVARVKLQDDEAHVERVAMLASGLDPEETWPDDIGDLHKEMYRPRARNILAMIDDLRGQRVFAVKMPGRDDDATTLRELFNNAPASDIRGPHADEFS